jgi:hypothetical protein
MRCGCAAPSDERIVGFGIGNLSVSRESALRWASIDTCARSGFGTPNRARISCGRSDFVTVCVISARQSDSFEHTNKDAFTFVCVLVTFKSEKGFMRLVDIPRKRVCRKRVCKRVDRGFVLATAPKSCRKESCRDG